MNPHAELERQIQSAEQDVAQKMAGQVEGRRDLAFQITRAAAKLNELDAEIAPDQDRLRLLQEELERRMKKTTGPWAVQRDGKFPAGFLYPAGSNAGWRALWVWLRVVSNMNPSQYQWEVHFSFIQDPRGRDIVLGPLTDNPEADFAVYRETVEAKLLQLGWYVADGEVPMKFPPSSGE